MLVANKPGVLVRVALVFARRGFNIDALAVSPAFDPQYSRMTITAQGNPSTLDQIIKQANKLVDVLHAEEHSGVDALHRELALLKLKATATNKAIIMDLAKKFHAHIVDESKEAIIIEQTGTTEELDKLEELLRKYGVLEMVRSGKLVMAKGKETT
jgi:acetolactate synthase small subunit